MRIVVFGKGERAEACIRAMVDAGFKPVAVFAEKNDHLLVARAHELGLPLLASEEELASINSDLLVLISYTRILRAPTLSCARLGTINLHGGPLPSYRGASVQNWQLVNGEIEGGVSIVCVDEGIDTGDILAEERFPIAFEDTIDDVVHKTLNIFPRLLVEVLRDFESGRAQPKKQTLGGRYYRKRRPEDGLLRWREQDALLAYNFVRALSRPYPGAFSMLGNRKVIMWAARIQSEDDRHTPGKILGESSGRFRVACAIGTLLVLNFEVEGFDSASSARFIRERIGGVFS